MMLFLMLKKIDAYHPVKFKLFLLFRTIKLLPI